MADNSSENPKNPIPNGPKGQGAESGSNQNDKAAKPLDATDGDIDSLLASATEALEQVDSQLGEAETEVKALDNDQESTQAKPKEATIEAASTSISNPPEVSKVDQALADLQQEIGSLSQQVDGDQTAANETTPIDDSLNSLPKKENVDDVLSALAEELTETSDSNDASSSTEEYQPPEMPPTEVAATDELAAGEEIDTVLADLEQDLQGASEKESTTEPPPTGPAEEVKTQQEAVGGDEGVLEPQVTADKAPPTAAETTTEAPSEQKAAREAEQVVAEELAEKQTPPTASSEDASETSGLEENYDHFSFPARLLIKVLTAVNRPFTFLSDSVKDILGLIAIITCIISILAAALLLLFN